MGRNGRKQAVFPRMVQFINANVGKVVTSGEILSGQEPGRNSETAYLYKFIKTGRVKIVDDNPVSDKNTMFEILKALPPHYTSVMLGDDIRIAEGKLPKSHKRVIY